ncbi:uncharacterized protein LOC126897799 [Daktulosphaira vitifoliae]|uniref:uncharacterized protein LOC126897799 n=1 Tax=Daktulosphaira vitifoliae TaxID=58002 RepID=UPI0021AB01E8|nr:uncharacterized protein LOC126897799 [Daktulosphaira vitifoliae]
MKTSISLILITLVYFLIQSAGVSSLPGISEWFSSNINGMPGDSESDDEAAPNCSITVDDSLSEDYYTASEQEENDDDDGNSAVSYECRLCLGDFNGEIITLPCCESKFCKTCFTPWIKKSKNKHCIICFKNMHEYCGSCKSMITGCAGKMFLTACCKTRLCHTCIQKDLKSCPYCNKTKDSVKWNIVLLKTYCWRCTRKIGKNSHSRLCTYLYCNKCFKKKINEKENCLECGEPFVSQSCISF